MERRESAVGLWRPTLHKADSGDTTNMERKHDDGPHRRRRTPQEEKAGPSKIRICDETTDPTGITTYPTSRGAGRPCGLV
jgi:hypothetical protein